MHHRLTSFCVRCGLRQPPGDKCLECGGLLADLTVDEARREALLAFRASYAEHEARRLARDVPSVRRAPLAFAAGGAVVLGMSLGIPLLTMGPLAVAVAGVAAATGGLAVGGTLRAVAPRFLLGKEDRTRIDREVRLLAERDLPIRTATAPTTREGLSERSGRLVGVSEPSPFLEEPVIAARLVGEVQGRRIDDAFFASGELRLERDAGTSLERCPLVSLAWIAAAPTLPFSRGALGDGACARLDAYLLERGLEVSDDTPLSLAVVRSGDVVGLIGRATPRTISDGYRGSIEVDDLRDAILERLGP